MGAPKPKAKTGIVAASFGTSYASAERSCIHPCEDALVGAFPAFTVRRAWTSGRVIAKVRERDGRHVDDVLGAIRWFAEHGYDRLCVQPLHLLAGHEFHRKILEVVAEQRGRFERLAIGMPVFHAEQDYRAVTRILDEQVRSAPDCDAALYMGHGTDHPCQSAYGHLQMILNDMGLPVHVATIDSYPRLDDVMRRLERVGARRILLRPLLLVAGDHACTDMAGTGDETWESRLGRAGYSVRVDRRALGEEPAFREIFARHAREAMRGWDVE